MIITMKPSGPQILEELERRIADDKASSQDAHHAPVYKTIPNSTDKEALVEQMEDIAERQDILNDSAPEVRLTCGCGYHLC